MSGIFGICAAGLPADHRNLAEMMMVSARPQESSRRLHGGQGAAMGVMQRWPHQQVAETALTRVAADADLVNLTDLAQEVGVRTATPEATAEIVGRLYEQHGLSLFDRLEGAFAISIWDKQQQQLVLAVDRLGLRTLYWGMDGERLLFGSRIGAVALAKREVIINPEALLQFFLHSCVLAPVTIYKDIERLEPGTWIRYRQGTVTRHRFWDIDYKESTGRGVNDWSTEVREQIRTSVHAHLKGCRGEQTGAYLSGGTDSSSVVAFMSESFSPVNTYSIFFEHPRYSEISFARTTAAHFRTNHHESCLRADSLAASISPIFDYYDEPFANSSAVGAYFCAKLAASTDMEVLLAGDGGDELFAGNERYASDKQFALYGSIPRWMRQGVVGPMCRALPKTGKLSLLGRYVRRATIPNPRRFFSYSFMLSDEAKDFFQSQFLEQVPVSDWLRIPEDHFFSAPGASSELNRLLYLDLKTTIADNDVRKVVGTAELAGVRVRFPLLDYRLAELSGRIPSRLKLKGFRKRYVFKEAMKGILPDRVLFKKKHGFGVPVGSWLVHERETESLVDDILSDPTTAQRGFFHPGFLSRIKQLTATHPAYYGEMLWSLLALELWFRKHAAPRAETIGILPVGRS